ncbi:MAG: CoA transferase [Chloroflexi bacterium]|nr:CoA transferase [Chloroflexota bacterium]
MDLTRYVAGPFCTRLLADYGAEVIKVERPGQGDPGRRLGPFLRDHPHLEKSGAFLHLNHNKVGITLNLKTIAGARIFGELAKWADVVVENFRPGVMDRLGLTYSSLARLKPGLVMTSISNFGQTGPYRDYKATEIIEYAIGGPMLFTGTSGREPVKLGANVGLYFAGQMAAVATLTAVYRKQGDGSGDHIDISIMETQAGSVDRQTAMLVNHQYTGHRFSRLDTHESYLGGIYPCKDGYIDVRARERMPKLIEMMEDAEPSRGPVVVTSETSEDLGWVQALDQRLRDWLNQRTRREVWAKTQEHRILTAPLYDSAGVLEDPHFRARGLWTRVEGVDSGLSEFPGRQVLMGATPWQVRRPAPTLGQHNTHIYCGLLGYSLSDLSRLRQMGVI